MVTGQEFRVAVGQHLVHGLGWILAEYTELTDKYRRRRGPPQDTGFFRIPLLILDWFWGAPPVD